MTTEAEIHFELYRHLQNAIEDNPRYAEVTYGRAVPEVNVDGGWADIVIEDYRERPFVVIEAKRLERGGRVHRDIDPYSPVVIRQAFEYAGILGAEYFATYNGRHLVLFETFERGTHLLDRRTRAYAVEDPQVFARELLHEIAALKAGRVNWDVRHWAFVQRLRVYHERLAREFGRSLVQALDDRPFRVALKNWVKEQGWERDYELNQEDIHRRFASQAAYLLMNKLVFYKLLEDSSIYSVPRVEMAELADPKTRREVFDNLIDVLDFEAVYQSDPIFDALPLTTLATTETEEFLEQLAGFDLSRFDHDVVGQVYQRVIPPEERHDLGQYYTPPQVVELITQLTVQSSDDVVMDPACGSGGFLVAAYHRLRRLKGDRFVHQETLEQIAGYDINRFPAHLSAINLAIQDLSSQTQNVNIEVVDFFHTDPLNSRIAFHRAGVRGEEAGWEEAFQVDAVVANPPYIRQEQIHSKDLCRRHLRNLGADHLSSRSDIYVYFFTHATEFLKPRGRIGFITSDRWLSVGYGEDLQRFFLDNFKIKAIVDFSRQLFELALISTCVTILERCDNEEERNGNCIRMLQLREEKSVDDIVGILDADYEPDMVHDEPSYRLVTLKQGTLRGETKWHRYIRAPRIYWDILRHPALTTMESIAEVERGLTTGANEFFYFRDEQSRHDLGIPDEFVRPLLKHVSELDHIELRPEDVSWSVLDIHPFVQEVEQESAVAPTADVVRKALVERGYQSLADYIAWGEAQGFNRRPSLRGRRVWFDLGDLDSPELMITEVYWRKSITPINRANAVVDKRLYAVRVHDGVDPVALGGILNSSLYKLMREMHGRVEQGEGMNRNTLMVYEACRLPVLDPRTLDDESVRVIKQSFERLLANECRCARSLAALCSRSLAAWRR